jgi:hypothetical protein
MTSPGPAPWTPTCPVCATPVHAPESAPCPVCGLPAAGRAGLVVARIGATLTELARDRDALLATLRAAAPGAPFIAAAAPPVAPPRVAPPVAPPAAVPAPPVPAAPPAPVAGPRRRLSPQQVLLGLGALLVVAAALAFVAVAWTRLGVTFQSVVVLTVTAAACAASALAARRGLRATEEALAAAGAALLAVALGAAWALGLLGLDAVPGRTWAGVSGLVVAGVALGLGRLTRTTAAWPLTALLVLQPVPFLLLPAAEVSGPVGVAAALAVAALDLAATLVLRRSLVPVPRVLAGLVALVGGSAGLDWSWSGDAARSWAATGLLVVAAAGAVLLLAVPGVRGPSPRLTAGPAAGVAAFAVAGSLVSVVGVAGALGAATAGLLLVTAGVLLVSPAAPAPADPSAESPGRAPGAEARLTVAHVAAVLTRRVGAAGAGLLAGGGVLAVCGASALAEPATSGLLAAVVLGATVPAALAAVRLPDLRRVASAVAVLAPTAAVVVARGGGAVSPPVAGSLFAVLAAVALGGAALRVGRPEELSFAGGATLTTVAGALVTAGDLAWGQLAAQLAVSGAAAAVYAVVSGRRPVAVAAVADLVVAVWVAVAGAEVTTVEAYTVPAALGLLVLALPALRAGAPSWSAEGPATAIALVPSGLLAVADPEPARLLAVVAVAAVLTVVGAVAHRQAPFVLGAAVLGSVVVARLAPYAPLVPRWVVLAAAGLLLLTVGATYERRRQQAREAVAWVAQMR